MSDKQDAVLEWSLVFCLPYLDLSRVAEEYASRDLGLSGIAIVDVADERVTGICERVPKAAELIALFKNEYGNTVNPACLIIRSDWAARLPARDVTPFVAFRNALALCDVLASRASAGGLRGAFYSDVYDFNPAQVTTDGSRIDLLSPAVDHFGMPTARMEVRLDPALPRARPGLTDQRLELVLGRIWYHRYVRGRSLRAGDRLFRSLETAYHACGMQHRNYSSLHEAGLIAVLWVSAFETLAKPPGDSVHRDHVLDMLAALRWLPASEHLAKQREWWVRRRRPRRKKGEPKPTVAPPVRRRLNIAQKLYALLYTARNKFVHGDRVFANLLRPFGDGRPVLLSFASSVYRQVLVSYLLSHWPSAYNREDSREMFAGLFANSRYREHLEKALVAAGTEVEGVTLDDE